jgi:hypothetical protein
MSVPHYEETYGESLEENFTAEFSADLAAILRRDGTPFSVVAKTRVTAAARETAARRDQFCDALSTELDSLENARSELTELLDLLDGPRIPDGNSDQFEDTLSERVRTRQ